MEERDLLDVIGPLFLPQPPRRLGVAVSGGGDSMALLSAMAAFVKPFETELYAITIDHGLRESARREIRLVAKACGHLGVQHHVEIWPGWDGGGNLQSHARNARYELITAWALNNQINTIVLGHTANDQAETVLMRLARGAGVDGLAAMSPRRLRDGITWLRPLLSVKREDLRKYLDTKKMIWAEDPSNENRDFERIRIRDALKVLEPLGISVDRLSDVASNMADARGALNWHTFLAAKEACNVAMGVVQIDLNSYRILPIEITRRILVGAIMWLNSSDYPPRRGGIIHVKNAIKQGVSSTLDGCQITRKGGAIYIFRELNALRDLESEVGDLWDERWYVTGPEDDPVFSVRSLGETGIKQLENWRDLGLPRAAVMSLPSVWKSDELISAPLLSCDDGWQAELDGGADAFYAALLSH